jgi:hypothetical protein
LVFFVFLNFSVDLLFVLGLFFYFFSFRSATVTIHLHNKGSEPVPYRPDLYGSTIQIERTFHTDKTGSYTLKSATGEGSLQNVSDNTMEFLGDFLIVSRESSLEKAPGSRSYPQSFRDTGSFSDQIISGIIYESPEIISFLYHLPKY